MSEANNLVGYGSSVRIDGEPMPRLDITGIKVRGKKVKPEPTPVEMYSAGTGAVRSSDLKKERWDLLSGAALRHLKVAMGEVCPSDRWSAQVLVETAADRMWQALGCETSCKTTPDSAVRLDRVTEGWAYLALAMEAEEGVAYRPGPRYPFTAVRRTAMASKEGEVKYGEENWLNGFRFKTLCNHSLRHMVRYSNGIVEDDELGHASWGFMTAVHMLLFRPDMCDLLVTQNYTITDELREYHTKHLSRKQLAKGA